MSDNRYDICVLGGGPGGYVAAIRAAQLGAKVALIEKEEVGGTCLNRGCIPTKAYLKHAELIYELEKIDSFGINISEYSIDWSKMKERKDGIVRRLTMGVAMLLKKNGVKLIKGTGKIINKNKIEVQGKQDTEVNFQNLIIATGSRPIIPKIQGVKREDVVTSREALNFQELPEKLLIIGGGVIGVEMATVFNSLDVEVTIVEMMSQLLPGFDEETSELLTDGLKKRGVNILTGARVRAINEGDGGLDVEVVTSSYKDKILADKVLMAVGRQPNLEGLEKLQLEMKNGSVAVDARLRTNYSNIYAIGDVIGGDLLAHVASREGIVAVENALGNNKKMDYMVVPRCVYTIPEVASVGLSEAAAQKKGYKTKTGSFPFAASGKALTAGHEKGFVKIVTDKKWDQVLGVQIVGPHATELIAEAALAIKLEATSEILAETIHAHPTLSETIMEAAENVHGLSIHI